MAFSFIISKITDSLDVAVQRVFLALPEESWKAEWIFEYLIQVCIINKFYINLNWNQCVIT